MRGRWWAWVLAAVVLWPACFPRAEAQAGDGVMSDAEVEAIRDAKFVPADCLAAYEKILNSREKQIDDLVAKPRHAGREEDLYDLMSQMAAIAEELTDHLDEYGKNHRDVRKALPKLVKATERWATSLRAPADDERYKVQRKLALDAVGDMRDVAEAMEDEQAVYFKEHPEAAKAEKARADHPYGVKPPE